MMTNEKGRTIAPFGHYNDRLKAVVSPFFSIVLAAQIMNTHIFSPKFVRVPTKRYSNSQLAWQRLSGWRIFGFCGLSGLVFTGCVGPVSNLSPLMQKAPEGLEAPIDGKAHLLVHRGLGLGDTYKHYTGAWDSTNFIADLGSGHSVAYSCEAGQHYFINR
jgi:hypothetical protein